MVLMYIQGTDWCSWPKARELSLQQEDQWGKDFVDYLEPHKIKLASWEEQILGAVKSRLVLALLLN